MNVFKVGEKIKEVESLNLFIRKWRPIDGWLIQDQNGVFVLPSHHSLISQDIYRQYRKNLLRNFLILCLTTTFICTYFYFTEPQFLSQKTFAFSLLPITAALGMFFSVNSFESFQNKSEALFNFQRHFKDRFKVFVPFYIAIGVAQFWSYHYLGGFEELVIRYGNYYPSIEIETSWRFVTGSIIHADFKHLLLNMVITVLFASTLSFSKSRYAYILFMFGAVASHAITSFASLHLYIGQSDALVGLSGGAYTLLAFSICYYLFKKKHLNIAFQFVLLIVYGEISSALLSNNSSHTAHIGGFIVGVICYFTLHWRRTAPN